jgi:hypothetical protein
MLCCVMLCCQAGFAASGHPAVRDELDLVEDEDQITHEMSLEDKHDPQVGDLQTRALTACVGSESTCAAGGK